MIVHVYKNTLGKSGQKVSSTKIKIKCDECGESWMGRWASYKDKPDDYQHLCTSCSNKAGRCGNAGKKLNLSDKERQRRSKAMKTNNPMESAELREAARERMKAYYDGGGLGYWEGKKRPDHSESMKEYMAGVFHKESTNPDLKRKYIHNLKRQSKFQRDVATSLEINGYKFETEYELYDKNDNLLYVVDLYDPKTKTCVSCNGDFFHARPGEYADDDMIFDKTAAEVRERDEKKRKVLKSEGVNQIEIWYTDWRKVKNTLDYPWKEILGY